MNEMTHAKATAHTAFGWRKGLAGAGAASSAAREDEEIVVMCAS
jgi:hypothetical protein